ncbi:MAG: RNA polymerase sigma factor [Clostridiales bacterium]|nr:RNA polymerase sigma factor [Clostridiales bacterium]
MFGTKSAEQNISFAHDPLETLIAEIAEGNKAAVSTLYEETKTAVYGFALSILKNASDAEDVLQETYVRIWSTADTYNPLGKPMAWVLTIAKNLSFSILRERSKTTDIPEESWLAFQAEGPAASTEDRMVLNSAMRMLSDEERQIIILHAVSGLKHIEIARLLDLPLPTVLSKYSRARKKLQNTLKEGN